MITLKDIAREVGVSISSVSLVLNDRDSGRIKPEIADRIRRAAEEMGYASNLLARGLKTRQTHTLGLLSDQVATIPFAGEMLAGAQVAAWEEGFLLLLIDTAGDRNLERPATTALLQRHVEGLILASKFHREMELPPVSTPIPTVLLDGRPKDPTLRVDWVVPDETGGAYAATRHLIDAGHRRIAFLTIETPVFVARELRLTGYQRALTEAGIPVDPQLIVVAAEPSTVAGREPAERLLSRPDRPTAVFCFSDQLAFSLYQAAHRLGLRIPEDVSVVGFDNQQFVADSLLPGLTTVQLPHSAMGAWAARQAIARLRGADDPAPKNCLMPCPLVERTSVTRPS
ncbi:LacI family DNA-binding transcriptional regulator [Actinoplanes bogorensis]|uniref:LacI family DNA-binding transcriptional regulator n=1 Tax=Paractinoplanes bogorensis TaxID=1610840 RepID=A0ABS5YJU4_9ACTN|nr:LacI family DNA-binding transcriptional regulator [Actinoplanes bogorensis]MBU2663747.1 LacI family DNA-binding transcriptional regulator [Actinoplanes bogorensis]